MIRPTKGTLKILAQADQHLADVMLTPGQPKEHQEITLRRLEEVRPVFLDKLHEELPDEDAAQAVFFAEWRGIKALLQSVWEKSYAVGYYEAAEQVARLAENYAAQVTAWTESGKVADLTLIPEPALRPGKGALRS